MISIKPKTMLMSLAVAAAFSACGGSDEAGTLPVVELPSITTDAQGQAKVTVTDEATADQQCEAMQAAWPSSVDADTVYFINEDGSNYMACGRG